MSTYTESVDVLAEELDSVAQVLVSLSADEWSRSTLLIPVDPVPNWTVLELAGHFGFAMNMIDTLLSEQLAGPPAFDRVSFFDQTREQLGPLVYRTTKEVAASKTSAEILDFCSESFSSVLARARLADPAFVGSAVLGTMRIDEFIATRILEAVLHGLDLAQALNRPATPSSAAVKCVADILDSVYRRKRAGSRPDALADDWLWVQVASGRRRHDSVVTPLLL